MVKDRVVVLHVCVCVCVYTGMNKVTSSFSLVLKGINRREESLKKHFDSEWIQNKVNKYIH